MGSSKIKLLGALFLVLGVSTQSFQQQIHYEQQQEPEETKAVECTQQQEVIAVVDGSDSIYDSDFIKLKNALIHLAKELDLQNGGQRFGAVVYSSKVSDKAPLSYDVDKLTSLITGFRHPKQGTSTHLGIQNMTTMMEEEGRPDVPRVGIVITDGRSINTAATALAASKARDAGINMFAVGVGFGINKAELRDIASSEDNVLELANFDQLLASVTSLVKKVCIVNGGWSNWTTEGYTECTASCGGGLTIRTDRRTCTNPVPSNGGKDCEGPETKMYTETCNTEFCPVHGGWSEWSSVTKTECSAVCGGGTRNCSQTRTCTNPAPRHGGRNCEGSETKEYSESCNMQECPVHGGWSEWSSVTKTECTAVCGGGTRNCTQTRTCTNPAPRYGGQNCEGSETKEYSESCNIQECPVHGGWSEWSSVTKTECTAVCGGGTRNCTQTRTCTNPAPRYGGRNCEGSETKEYSESCNIQECPVHGGWSEWSSVTKTECTAVCGGGTRNCTQTRTCTNPAPRYGGQNCEGSETKEYSESCNMQECPVHGGWSEWSSVTKTECSAVCGGGTRNCTQTRTCTNPAPRHGGQNCEGSETKEYSESCNMQECPAPRHPCDGCQYVNGIGLNPHRTDCNKYIHCYNYGNDYYVMSCPAGLHFDASDLTCTFPDKASCDTGARTTVSPGITTEVSPAACKKRVDTSDNKYYMEEIAGFGWVKRPCGFGTVFDINMCDCISVTVSPSTTTEVPSSVCDGKKKEDTSDNKFYMEKIGGHGWVKRPCGTGTVFDINVCDCVSEPVTVSPSTTTEVPSSVCDGKKKEDTSDNKFYMEKIAGHGWVKRPCGTGTVFDINVCDCVSEPVTVSPSTTTEVPSSVCDGKKKEDTSDNKFYMEKIAGHGWVKRPCGTGTVFDINVCDCVSEPVTVSPSTTTEVPSSVCDGKKKEDTSDNKFYMEKIAGHGWVKRPCGTGTVFDINVCDCVSGPVDTPCQKQEVIGNNKVYLQVVPGAEPTEMHCPSGTVFYIAACNCVNSPVVVTTPRSSVCRPEVYLTFDSDFSNLYGNSVFVQNEGVTIEPDGYASFTENSGLRIPRFSNMDFKHTLRISFLFHAGQISTTYQAIVSNADCDIQGSIYILQTPFEIEFRVRNKEDDLFTLSLPYMSSQGVDRVSRSRPQTPVSLTVYGGLMTAEVGSAISSTVFTGDIAKSHCALQIGRGAGFDHFTGDLDEFKLSLCLPEFESM